MTNQKRQTLTAQIRQRVIPKVLLVTSLLTLAIAFSFFIAGQEQVRQQHQADIDKMTTSLDLSVRNLQSNIRGLAKNDLLINGLIDYQMRDEYLPLFFQSLSLVRDQQASAALFDFAGDIILTNNWEAIPQELAQTNWQKEVLENSQSFILMNANGLTIIEPIMFSGAAEGALAIYVKDFNSILSKSPSGINKFVFDEAGGLLYSSSYTNNVASINDTQALEGFIYQSSWRGFSVVSQESYQLAYRHLLWLIPILLIAILGTLFGSLYGVSRASRSAARTFEILHRSLQDQVANSGREKPKRSNKVEKNNEKGSEKDEEEPVELANIRDSYTELTEQVLSLSLSNSKITSVLNSLHELLIVTDFNRELMLQNQASQVFFSQEDERDAVINMAVEKLLNSSEARFNSNYSLDGETRTIAWTAVKLLDASEEHIGFVLTGDDVSEKLSLEAKANLRRKAMDASSAAISVSDITLPHQPLVYVNDAFTEITGYSKEEALGRNCKFLQGDNTEPQALIDIRYAIDHHLPIVTTLNNYKKDGELFINRLSLTPVFENDNSVRYYVGVQQDVSVEKKSAEYLEAAKQDAERTAAAQARFFASMNHELRTPLHGINGMLSALKTTTLSDDQAQYVKLASLSSSNLLTIVNDVLTYAKAESGEIGLNDKAFDLTQFIVDLSEGYSLQCEQAALTFELKQNIETPCWLSLDQVRLKQIFDNLFGNALKFTKQGKICISTNLAVLTDEQAILKFSISDTGIGIDKDQLPMVFSRFSQALSSTRDVTQGTGLGLTICEQLCHLMGGEIKADSELGVGSTFTFSVKARKANKQTAKDDHEKNNISLGAYSPAILVVEDNDINRQVVLANLKGARTMIAENGLKALQILNSAKVKFDLILMDCQMPEMDGYTATRLIRDGEAGDAYKDIPIIALTAYATTEDKDKCDEAGMNDFLSKPFNPADLLHKINKWGLR